MVLTGDVPDRRRNADVPIEALAKCCSALIQLGKSASLQEHAVPIVELARQMRRHGVSPERAVIAFKQLLGCFAPDGEIIPKEHERWMEPLVSAAINAYYDASAVTESAPIA